MCVFFSYLVFIDYYNIINGTMPKSVESRIGRRTFGVVCSTTVLLFSRAKAGVDWFVFGVKFCESCANCEIARGRT